MILMYKYILKQFKRSAVTNALFCLLLTLSGVLLCLSAGLWYSAHKALLDIDETITTIAIPDRSAISRRVFENDLNETELDILQKINEVLYPSGLLRLDERRFFRAFADDISPVLFRLSGIGAERQIARFSGQATAAFHVTCTKIETDYFFVEFDHMSDTAGGFVYEYVTAHFSIEETLHITGQHTIPRQMRIALHKNPDGTYMFKQGMEYVVIGNYTGSFGIGNFDLLHTPAVGQEFRTTGHVYSNDELNTLINRLYMPHRLPDESYPMDIMMVYLSREPQPEDGWYSFIEVENSLEETRATQAWERMEDAIKCAAVTAKSVSVLTTNNPDSLLRFNQNRNLFDEGRSFIPREIEDGTQVCLVSRQFADTNDISIGDTLPLQMYASVLGSLTETFIVSDDGRTMTNTFWIPSMYQSDLEISQPVNFTVVGIYNTLRLDTSQYAISPNTVVIPDRSFDGIDGQPVSMFDTSMPASILADAVIVPNGKINETTALINNIVPGYGDLFRFYDQGYNSLVAALDNLRFGMSWILALAVSGWVAVLLIFLMFFVTRKRRDTLLLYAVGISSKNRFNWVFSQCLILVLTALVISLAVSLPLYEDIVKIAGGTAQEFSDSFRDYTLSDAADAGFRTNIPLDTSPLALIFTVTGAAVVTLAAAGALSVRSAVFKSLSDKRGDD